MGELKSRNCFTIRTSIIGHEIKKKHGLLEWFLCKKKVAMGLRNAFLVDLQLMNFQILWKRFY